MVTQLFRRFSALSEASLTVRTASHLQFFVASSSVSPRLRGELWFSRSQFFQIYISPLLNHFQTFHPETPNLPCDNSL